MADDRAKPPLNASLAPRRVPEAYVRAEVWAFPLTSREALADCLVELDPELEDLPTRHLWRACEDHLTREASGWSLDRFIAVRDRAWFWTGRNIRGRHRKVSMHAYLRGLADEHLVAKPGQTYVKEPLDASTCDATSHYRWLNFALPEDLLLAALPSAPPPSAVSFTNLLLLRRLIDMGMAEIHQHVTAGMDFPILWAAALAELANPNLGEDALRSPGAWGDGRQLLSWLLVAAIARVVLAEYLASREAAEATAGRGLWEFLARHCGRLRSGRVGMSNRHLVLFEALHALTWGWQQGPPPVEQLQYLYGELHPEGRRLAHDLPSSVEEVWRMCDPIAVRLGLRHPDGGERWLIRRGLAYLEQQEKQPDQWFAAVFWAVVRLRCQYYRYIIQRPLIAGLQWFIRFQDRIGRLRAPLQRVLPEVSLLVAGRGEPIAALEIRTTGAESSIELANKLRNHLVSWKHVLGQVEERRAPEFGIVLHFAKQRDRGELWTKGRPKGFAESTCAQPSGSVRTEATRIQPLGSVCGLPSPEADEHSPRAAWPRFAEYAAVQLRYVEAFSDLVRAHPLLLWLIRGVDVCTDELGVPTWVIAAIFREMRDAAARASSAQAGEQVPPPLRVTAHAGEDFRHLMSGLRRVFESVQYLMGQKRGRIGHATALGIEPRTWGETTGPILVPLEDHLSDLVFEWRLYTGVLVPADFFAEAPAGRVPWLVERICELAGQMFESSESNPGESPRLLAKMQHVLNETGLYRLANGWTPRGRTDDAGGYLYEYLNNPETFRRGQKLIEIGAAPSEIEALTSVQNILRRAMAARGIVVEVNPSSNLLIGDMLDLRHHPILRLRPIQPSDDAPPAVPIAIGSDDPVTFCTSLMDEYALLGEAARAAGYTQPVIQEWLEGIRRTSLDARFTVSWRPSAEKMTSRLLQALDDYLLRPRSQAKLEDYKRRCLLSPDR